MREIVHIQVGQCGNQIGAKVRRKKKTSQEIDEISVEKFMKISLKNLMKIEGNLPENIRKCIFAALFEN